MRNFCSMVLLLLAGCDFPATLTEAPANNALTIEVYGKQFEWAVRYPGEDGQLGPTHHLLVSNENPVGLLTAEFLQQKQDEVTQLIQDAAPNDLDKLERMQQRLAQMKVDSTSKFAYDDIVVDRSFHLPVNQEIKMFVRSQDVIHCVYLPQFGIQVNAVPGMTTQATFVAEITTDAIKIKPGDVAFNYEMMCNKICGKGHYSMKMEVVIESATQYQQWLNNQQTVNNS